VLVEVPTGRGRVDILILYKNKEYIIETKRYTDNSYYKAGKKQLAEYLKSEGLQEGYYVVFSNVHQDEDKLKEKEQIEGKTIYRYIIRTNFKVLILPDSEKTTCFESVPSVMVIAPEFEVPTGW